MESTPPLPPDEEASEEPQAGATAEPERPEPEEEHVEDAVERMQRERKHRARRKRLFLYTGGAVLGVLVLVGAFFLWRRFQVKEAQETYEAAYERADLKQLRRFTPDRLQEVKRLAEEAEQYSSYLQAGNVVDKYERAVELLREIGVEAFEASGRYTQVRDAYLKRKTEAEQRNIPRHVPDVWDKIIKLESEAGITNGTRVTPQVAKEKLQEAVELLKDLSRLYPAIEAYANAKQAFEEVSGDWSKEAWARNIPEKLKRVEEELNAARKAYDEGEWRLAARHYATARTLLIEGQSTIAQKEEKALEAAQKFRQAYQQLDGEKYRQSAISAWEKIQSFREDVQNSLDEADYDRAAETGRNAVAYIEQTRQDMAEAEANRERNLRELKDLWDEIRDEMDFLETNWPERFVEIRRDYNRALELAEGVDYLQADRVTTDVLKRLKKLQEEAATLREKAVAARRRAREAFDAVQRGFLAKNLPEVWSKASSHRETAQKLWKEDNLQGALQAYRKSAGILEDARAEVRELRENTTALRELAQKRLAVVLFGLEIFEPKAAREAQRLVNQGNKLWRQNEFVAARELFKRAKDLLPSGRFRKNPDGTVIDYNQGLMWVADVSGKGGNNGEPLDWYRAFVWVNKLQFAGYEDWGLPSEEQMFSLLELSRKQLEAYFPGSYAGPYWSGTDRVVDVIRAIAVDLEKERSYPESKKEKLLVRPVRSP